MKDVGDVGRVSITGCGASAEAQQRDVAAHVDLMAAQPMGRSGPVGVLGYCFSGALAL